MKPDETDTGPDTGGAPATLRRGRTPKAAATRDRLMEAAVRVFRNMPYTAASLRTIQEEGGFNHSLVGYHFKDKSGLFGAVVSGLMAPFLGHLRDSLTRAAGRPADEEFDLFLADLFEYGFAHPEFLEIVMQNTGEPGVFENVAQSLKDLQAFIFDISGVLDLNERFAGRGREAAMFVLCLATCLGNLLGTSRFHARILGMEPQGREYRDWVWEAVRFVFAPAWGEVMSQSGRLRPEPSRDLSPATRLPRKRAPRERETKGEATKRRIVLAAGRVFSALSYESSTIRAIGREARMDFTILHHYFPSKADLFHAVAAHQLEMNREAAKTWYQGVETMELKEGLSVFLDRALGHFFENPESPGLLMKNMGQWDRVEEIGAASYIRKFYADTMGEMLARSEPRASAGRVFMWQYIMALLVTHYTGAASNPAAFLGLNPQSPEYRRFIRDALAFVFYPSFKRIIFGQGAEAGRSGALAKT